MDLDAMQAGKHHHTFDVPRCTVMPILLNILGQHSQTAL